MFGFAGKLLFVDLSDRTYTIEDLSEKDARNFLGGAGLGAKILFDRMPAHTPAFAPESMIGFVSGPVNGNLALLGGRYTVVSKSPVTDGWNDSNSGGSFGPKLKKSGFDGVFVKGIASEPVYIFIDNGTVEIRPAGHLWGKTVSETEKALQEEIGDRRIGAAVIGPAGERKSYMAAVMNDTHRAAGRGGSGAVMGSKNLKALVVKGDVKIDIADREKVLEINKKCLEWEKEGPVKGVFNLFYNYGTGGTYVNSMLAGDGSIRNFKGTPMELPEEDFHALSAAGMDKRFRKKKYACNACPLGCGAIYDVPESKHDLKDTGRPEYETTGMFGANLKNNDAVVVNDCNYLCNEYGYDVISVGGTFGWLMEAYNTGVFTQEELDGIDFSWGNAEAIEAMMEKLCADEGIGHAIQNGSREAVRTLGKGEENLVLAGGMEIAAHDSRWSTGLTRTYKYDPTPGRHVKGGLGSTYGNQPPEVKYNYTNTAERDLAGTIRQEIFNTAGFCMFAAFAHIPGGALQYLNAICGFGFTEEDANLLGQRLFAIRQAFNLREGYFRKDATLSPLLEGKPPMKEGPLAGVTVDTELMADNFYKILGWDVETGMIPKEVLEKYGGMEKVITDLYPEE